MKSEKQGILSAEPVGNSSCPVTLGKLPDSGGGKGFVCLFSVDELVKYFKLFCSYP